MDTYTSHSNRFSNCWSYYKTKTAQPQSSGEDRMKKLSTFILILLLCFMLVAILNIGKVKAASTIYIRADGIVGGTDRIHQIGNIYFFDIDKIQELLAYHMKKVIRNPLPPKLCCWVCHPQKSNYFLRTE